MNRRNQDLFLGFLIGVGFAGILAMMIAIFQGRREPNAPEVAGQAVPSQWFKIDFTKRYDLIIRAEDKASTYRNCKILGFTGKGKDGADSGWSSYSYDFDRWLVIELPDKRKAYLPARSIQAFEESTVQ